MTQDEKDQYILVLENFKNVFIAERKGHGWSMKELDAIKAVETFEDSLPCNHEFDNEK
jgi:hypothetical protein